MHEYKAIESHIRNAHIERSAYLGTQLGNALGSLWLACADLLDGARAGMEEHRRRRTVAAAHAAPRSAVQAAH